MPAIGIRELKERTSEILRRVREDRDTFEVTYHGKVIARIVPVAQPPSEEELKRVWERWDRLAEEISKYWPKDVSAVQAIREDRREL
jgi:prevent-host-death family protein